MVPTRQRTAMATIAATAASLVFAASAHTNHLWMETQKFEGTTLEDDSFGRPAFDTDTLFISATHPSQAGQVNVYNNVGGTWTFSETLMPTNSGVGDRFGVSAAVNGSRGVFAQFNIASFSTASAWIFEESAGTWSEVAELVNPGAVGNNFGLSADLGGGTAVVGARRQGTGAAYVFEESAGSWSNTQTLLPVGGGTASQFGRSVYYDGADIIAVADHREDDPTGGSGDDKTGAVHIYQNQSGTWTHIQRIGGATPNHELGSSLAGQGGLLVIGATQETGSGEGTAFVYEQQVDGTFSMLQELVPSSPPPTRFEFGFDVDIDGDTIVVGSSYNTVFCPKEGCFGAVHVFENQGGTFSEVDVLTGSDSISQDLFGSVAISGDTIAVGAGYWNDQGTSFFDDDSFPKQGAAYIFTRDAAGLVGDYNGNGIVDAADYTIFRDNLGGDSAVLGGNGSGAATVVQADYDLWKQNFGSSGTGSSAAVPEPTSLLLLALAVLGTRSFYRVRLIG